VKLALLMFFSLFLCDLLLNLPAVLRLLGLPVPSSARFTPRVMVISLVISFVVIISFQVLETVLIQHYLDRAIEQAVAAEHMRMAFLLMLLSMVTGLYLAKYMGKRHDAEEALRVSQERFSAIFDSVNDAIFLQDTVSGSILDVNGYMSELFGYSREEARALSLGDISSGEPPYTATDALTWLRRSADGHPQVFEWRFRRKDGRLFWGEVNMRRAVIGGADRMLMVVRDISRRKMVETELHESERRYRMLFDSAGDAIFLIEGERIVDCNNRALELFACSWENILGSNLVRFSPQFQPDGRSSQEKGREKYEAALTGEPQFFEWRHARYDGSVFDAEVNLSMIDLPSGRFIQSIVRDISERKRVEEVLKKSEYALAEAQRIAHIGSWELDHVDNRLTWSSEIYRIFGLLPQEFNATYEGFLDVIHPDDRMRVDAAYADSVRTGQPFDIIHRIIRKTDGELRYVHEMCEHTRDASGKIIRSLGIAHDITESKMYEDALAESNRNYRMVVSSISKIIWRLSFDEHRQLKTVYISDAAERLLGLPDGALQNSLEKYLSFVHPDDLSSVRKTLEEARTADPGQPLSSEYRVRRQDGELRWHLLTGTAMRTQEGVLQVFGTTDDVTAGKRAEEERERLIADIRNALGAVSRSQKEWQDTFDSITDIISIHDLNYNIVRVNKAFSEYVGLPYRQLLGRKCYELLHCGGVAPVPDCPHARTLADGKPSAAEQVDAVSGKTLRISTYPYHAPDGSLIGSIHIARDITEEKEREMRMIMTERLASLGQMASGIAHEINNPLESVMICSEMLLQRVAKDNYDHAQFEKYLKIIDEEVMRCRDITSNMLSFARQTTLTKSDIDVHLLLDKAIDLVGYQGRLKNVTVSKKYGERFPVAGNEGELRQVFLVLLINALDAMENKGAISVETGADAGRVWIKISDTGPGIAADNLQKIFNPFFTTKIEKGGTGLGLSIAHRIIANHRGTLTVISEQGCGATFTVTLPR
jgi:PAS domain S-box-containing protein